MAFSIDELRKRGTISPGAPKQEIVSSIGNSTSLSALREMSNSISANLKNKNNIEQQITTVSSTIIKETSKIYHEQKVEIVFLIDKSSSCRGTEMATCNSYDHLIDQERKNNFSTIVTNVLFDGSQQEITFRRDISQIKSLKYDADGGSTAIYDTVCTYINKIMNAQNSEAHPPKKTIVAIMTDGQDNNSKSYTDSDARKLVEMAKNRGWEFIFLGAMENAYNVGISLGINSDNIAKINMSDEGMYANFKAIEEAINLVRKHGKIDSSWKNSIQNLSLEDKEQAKRLRLDMK